MKVLIAYMPNLQHHKTAREEFTASANDTQILQKCTPSVRRLSLEQSSFLCQYNCWKMCQIICFSSFLSQMPNDTRRFQSTFKDFFPRGHCTPGETTEGVLLIWVTANLHVFFHSSDRMTLSSRANSFN